MRGLGNAGKCLLAELTPSIQADWEVLGEVVLCNMAIDVEDDYNGLEICGGCRMEGTTERKRMMIRSRRSDNAMAGDVDNENFHSQRVERRRAVRLGRGGYRWEGGCEEITTSRGATLCNARCVRKTAKSADAVALNLEHLAAQQTDAGLRTC
jgi:hypothetical protein